MMTKGDFPLPAYASRYRTKKSIKLAPLKKETFVTEPSIIELKYVNAPYKKFMTPNCHLKKIDQ